ncbi:hypothetical protein TNCV_2512011 [Trichonephila clavipes]|nr:hypothetical protein TNCV_2512011 [Trichonephila clavipes]
MVLVNWTIGVKGGWNVHNSIALGRSVVDNVDKITEITEVNRHVSSRNIEQELEIDHKTVLSNLRKVGFKTKLHVWRPHQLTSLYRAQY